LTWEVFSPGNFGERGTDGMDLIKFLGGTKRTFEQTLKKCVARILSEASVDTEHFPVAMHGLQSGCSLSI
jgi:hypothetical protein